MTATKKHSKYAIIIDPNITDPPKPHEIHAAKIAAQYFQHDILFVRPACGKTPDFIIGPRTWELKSPTGGSKNTFGNNLRKARHQAPSIIMDLTRCKFTNARAISRIKHYLSEYPQDIRKVAVITKDGRVLEVFDKT